MKKDKLVVLQGKEDALFERFCLSNYPYNAEVILPSTWFAFFIRNGVAQNPLSGGGRMRIFPDAHFFSKKENVDVVLVNTSHRLSIKWGTSERLHFYQDHILLTVGAHGVFEARVSNPKKFFQELVGENASFTSEDLQNRLQQFFLAHLLAMIEETIRKENIDLLAPEKALVFLGENLRKEATRLFNEKYGIEIPTFSLLSLNLDEESKTALEQVRKEGSYCPECGSLIGKDVSFCPACGKAISRCPSCHRIVDKNMKYCITCGEKIVFEEQNNEKEQRLNTNEEEIREGRKNGLITE